jgi:uncharacterized repeat protein (TIGR01451 family)
VRQEEGEEVQWAFDEGEEVMTRQPHHPGWTAVLLASLAICLAGAQSAPASVFKPSPGWNVTAHTFPTNLAPGANGTIAVRVSNIGAASSSGTVTVTDTLPPGVTATQAGSYIGIFKESPTFTSEPAWDCTGNGAGGPPQLVGASVVTCTNDPTNLPRIAGGGGGPNRFESSAPGGEFPYLDPELAIAVSVSGAAEESQVLNNRVTVAGGGAPASASTEEPITISSKPSGFGFAGADTWFSNADGTFDTQAGSHPYEALFSFDLANVHKEEFPAYEPAGHESRNLVFNLPPGLVGNPYAVPMCTRPEFNAQRCPLSSQVGVITIEALGTGMFRFPVYNMVPPAGEPAEFAFSFEGISTYLDTSVRSGSDYGIATHVNNIVQRTVLSSVLILWGNPGDSSHDPWRTGNVHGCSQAENQDSNPLHCKLVSSGGAPFLTLPTSCVGPQTFSLSVNAWEDPSAEAHTSFLSHDNNGNPVGFTGCEGLSFGPTITTSPDTSAADTPTGLMFDVKPSTGGLLDPNGVGSSDIQNTSVTLPEGVVINPGQAAGLQACQESEANVHVEGVPPACPLKSKVGTDEAELPILKNALKGNVYVLQSNPPNLRLLITAFGEGVEVKLILLVHLDEETGRLTARLDGTPQAPVSDFRLSFSGGAQAALATPTTCGTYTTTTDFTSWANQFIADAFPTASFGITSGTNGAPCPSSPLPFSPSLIAGSTTDQAGGFTDFTLLLQASDDQQRIEKLQFKVPQGLLGMISHVQLCGEPQARDGTCSSASQIGHTVVASGPGPYPLVVPQPGQPPAAIYLTGPYKGAPYGLSIVVPIVVGPFTLQTQIVRAKIEIDPLTAQITVTTDPLPQIVDGVPTDLRTVNAVIDKPGFMFNPTNCSPMSFSGTVFSAQGTTAAISSPFQMGSCRALLFKPNFKVSTSGKTSRKNGASLDAKILYPTGPLGANQASSQSNLRSVKVDLPKQLPSRLTTLQKACTSATFEANPANCPSASRVGTVAAITPVLPVTLTGPAYFVSYGGAKFPELVFALQGYGVTIYVHGETFISPAGITSSTFHQVPDVPIYSFELKLPQGPFSALAANGNLCKTKLKMPTRFTAQDGAVIHQSTPIGVTGCAKAKKRPKKVGQGRKR